jgi:hypothetical protein
VRIIFCVPKIGGLNMAEYAPVNLEQQHVDDLIITGPSPEDQSNFEDLKGMSDITRADRIAFPKPFRAIADGTLLPAMLKLQELHGYTNIHILDTVGIGEHKETRSYTSLRRIASEAIGHALSGVAIAEYVLDSEYDSEEEYRRLAAACSDHRYQEAFDVVISNYMGNRAWRLIHPGPSIYLVKRNLIRPVQDIDPDELGIFDHIDCGAGGGQAAHDNSVTRESQAHFRESRLAETILSEDLPYLKVHSHVVGPAEELPPPHIPNPQEVHEKASDKYHN